MKPLTPASGIDRLIVANFPDLTCLKCLARGNEPCLCEVPA